MIPDTSLAKRAILRRIRSAQGHGDPSKASPADRARVEQRDAYLAARPRGKGPSVGADLLDHFCEQAQRMASSVERVSGYADVPQAVLRYLITHQLSLRVAAWPLLSTID
ncbi:MAG: lactate utilization protein C, partial [Betaproteobacteria bacterium]|nr:lactate utilization protein C [Betaproteobacteria bacterium]